MKMKNWIITAECDPYNAKFHYNGSEIILKRDGATPVQWVIGEFDTEEEAKAQLYEWALEYGENIDLGDAAAVTEEAKSLLEDNWQRAQEFLDTIAENGYGIYMLDGQRYFQVMAVGDNHYTNDVMKYAVESVAELDDDEGNAYGQVSIRL